MEVVEEIRAHGHRNIRATHRSTIEITREEHLTPRGDCIVAVGADKALRDFSEAFKAVARQPGAVIEVTISVDGFTEVIRGFGSPSLTFGSDREIVIRKSTYVCDRTLMIRADKAAADLDRRLIESLRNPDSVARITVRARLERGAKNYIFGHDLKFRAGVAERLRRWPRDLRE